MHTITNTRDRRGRRGGRLAALLATVALGAGLVAPLVASASTGRPAAARHHAVSIHAGHGTVVAMADGPYGAQLIDGTGQLAGYSLYAITSDAPPHFGCTTTVFHLGPQGFSCTGPLTDQNQEWPPLLTTAAPKAGPGVNQALLSSVYRKGLGHQVTYGGHPLYLFDNSAGQVTGEGFDEPSLPPDQGSWWLVSPAGTFLMWNQTLASRVDGLGATALSAMLLTGGGWHAFPLYSYSLDTSTTSACSATCARLFEPLLTTGTPGIEGAKLSGTIGTITRADGTTQLTYNGHPLYLFGDEGVKRSGGFGGVALGDGNGKVVGGGTFSVVTP
jgi:predicted lipoprotein with Yx(FWY)xxD motif